MSGLWSKRRWPVWTSYLTFRQLKLKKIKPMLRSVLFCRRLHTWLSIYMRYFRSETEDLFQPKIHRWQQQTWHFACFSKDSLQSASVMCSKSGVDLLWACSIASEERQIPLEKCLWVCLPFSMDNRGSLKQLQPQLGHFSWTMGWIRLYQLQCWGLS